MRVGTRRKGSSFGAMRPAEQGGHLSTLRQARHTHEARLRQEGEGRAILSACRSSAKPQGRGWLPE